MLPRKPRFLIILALLFANSTGSFCIAEESQPVPQVLYHWGDDARWADPHLDDRAWSVAPNGRWPTPAFYSNGFLWVRLRLPVRRDVSGSLAIRVNETQVLVADEVFVNGVLVGKFGRVPPYVLVENLTGAMVHEVPRGLTEPGATALVSLRAWYPPMFRETGLFDSQSFEIDQSRTLYAEEEASLARVRLKYLPAMALSVFLLLIGATVLGLWRSSGSRELLLSGGLLLSFPPSILLFGAVFARLVHLTASEFFEMVVLLQIPFGLVLVEYVWRVNGLKGVWFKRLAVAAWVIFNLCALIRFLASEPSAIVAWSLVCSLVAMHSYNVLILAANLWVIFIKRQNRLVAATMTLPPIVSSLTLLRFRVSPGVVNPLFIALFIAMTGISVALTLRAWREWRSRDALQAEFDAAREVQQQLVVPAVDVPGFKIESAYTPAKDVGGDFFRILLEEDGAVLLVVGDVSGKGLKAAMTVSAIMGALHDYPSSSPTEVLTHLNRVLYGRVSGFVTCCAALIATDGTMTLANAGNPAPYRNGEEMAVEPGLPLGMLAETRYAETRYQIAPGDRLTFVSDGVVEATNPQGELYGFERTRAISKQPANTIADAATQFGQQDDITVVTLTRERVGASASTKPSVPALSV